MFISLNIMKKFPDHIDGRNFSELCVLRKKITEELGKLSSSNFPYSYEGTCHYIKTVDELVPELDEEKKMLLEIKEELENKYFVCDVKQIFVPTNGYNNIGYEQLFLVIDREKYGYN